MNRDFLISQTKFLSRLPGVEAIFLSGSRAQGMASDNSDIDLFILATPGRIWTARFFVYMKLFLKGKMRRNKNTKELFCPNHFITTDALEIREKDAYSANLFSHNIPLHDVNNYFVQFAETNQPWVKKFGESFDTQLLRSRNKSGNKEQVQQKTLNQGSKFKVHSLKNKALSSQLQAPKPKPQIPIQLHRWTESFLKHLQKAKIERHPDSRLTGAKIILTDKELRFHPRPRNIQWRRDVS